MEELKLLMVTAGDSPVTTSFFYKFLPFLLVTLFLTSTVFAFSYYAPYEADNKLLVLGETDEVTCWANQCFYNYSITNNDSIAHTVNVVPYLNTEIVNGTLKVNEVTYTTINYDAEKCIEYGKVPDLNGSDKTVCTKTIIEKNSYQEATHLPDLKLEPTKTPTTPITIDSPLSPKTTVQTTLNAGQTKYYRLRFTATTNYGELLITTKSDSNPLIKASLDPPLDGLDLVDGFESGDENSGIVHWGFINGVFDEVAEAKKEGVLGMRCGEVTGHQNNIVYDLPTAMDANSVEIAWWEQQPIATPANNNRMYISFEDGNAVATNVIATNMFNNTFSFRTIRGGVQVDDAGFLAYVDATWYLIKLTIWGNGEKVDMNVYAADGTTHLDGSNLNAPYGKIKKIIMNCEKTTYYDHIMAKGLGIASTGTASFTYTINTGALSVDLNSTHSRPYPSNAAASDWNWTINGLQQSLDENFVYSPITEYTDLNTCINIGFADSNHAYKCTTFNTGKIYGDTNFYFYDEYSKTATSATIDFNGTSYTGTSFYLPSKQITNSSSTNVSRTFTITKTGYGTRYYSIDMNQYSNLDVNFLVLPDSNGSNIDFKFWETDQTTLLSNADVEIYHIAGDHNIVSRRKTNATGDANFFLNSGDGNYIFKITASDGTIFNYGTVSLTVYKPASESTGLIIDANWNVYVSGLGASSDTNLDDSSKVLAIYSETVEAYIVTVSSNHADPAYYSRSYEIRSTGNQPVLLQPYLVSTDDATQVKIVTSQDNGAQISPYPGLTIKIFKQIPGGGRELVEQVITDIKGEALSYLIVGGTYEFEIYDTGMNILSFGGDTTPTIKIASATIYITIDTSSFTNSFITQKYWSVAWNPTKTYFNKLTVGTQVFGFVISNPDASDMNITAYVTQNDTNFRHYNTTSSATTVTYNHAAINWTDINKGIVTQTVILRVDGNVYIFTQSYTIQTSFGGYYDPIEGLKSGIRTDFGCSTTGYCIPTLILAIIACTGLVVFLALKTKLIGGQGSAIIFVIGMGLFTYLTWVPIELTLVVTIIVAAFVINDRGGRGEN